MSEADVTAEAGSATDPAIGSGAAFHHIGVAVADIGKALPHYRAIFGFDEVEGPYDDPIQKVRVLFLTRRGATRGESPCVELVAPLEGAADAPVHRYLKKEAGAYHLCYEVDGIDATLGRLRSAGCLIISGPVPAVAFGGRRIAWLFTPTRQLVELVERAGSGAGA